MKFTINKTNYEEIGEWEIFNKNPYKRDIERYFKEEYFTKDSRLKPLTNRMRNLLRKIKW